MNSLNITAIIQKIFRILRRRIHLILLPFVIIMPLSLLIYKKLPKKYSSFSKILIQEPKYANPFLLQFSSAPKLKKRINLLINIVTSHKILGELVEKIAREDKKQLSLIHKYDAVVRLRKKNIKILYMGDGLVQITYKCQVPRRCYENLNFLFKRFMKETLAPEKEAVQRSSKFLSAQIQRLKQQLNKTEITLMEYKSKHSLELPRTFDANMNAYIFANKQHLRAAITLSSSIRRRDFLFNKVRFVDPVLEKLKQKQLQTQVLLSYLRTHYSAKHPKVLQAKFELTHVQRAIVKYTPKKGRTLKQLNQFFDWKMSSGSNLYKDPQTGKLQSEGSSPFERLQETLLQIAVLKKEVKKYEEEINKLRKRMKAYPIRELQLNQLQREARVSRLLYEKLRNLYEESLIRRELEVFESSRRFQVIEPAILPLFPDSPKFIFVIAGGIGGSIFFGLALMALAEIFERSIQDEDEAIQLLGMEVIGNVKDLPHLFL